MNYSKITLFRNTKFYPNQNYKIDDIDEFLNSYLSEDKKVFDRQQYWKINGIIKEFKLDISQADIKNIHEFNYAKVEMITGDEVEFVEWKLYYFILKFEWLSRSTIKLFLRLDTLNTFLDTLQFHPKTFIEREHTDRWNYESYIKDNEKITLLRNIPELNEGLNPQKYAYSIIGDSNFSFQLINKSNALYITPSVRQESWIAHYLGLQDGTPQLLENSPLIFTIGQREGFVAMPYIKPYYGGDPNVYESTFIEDIDVVSNNNQKILILPYAPHEELLEWTNFTESNPFEVSSDESFVGIHFRYEYAEGTDIYLNGFHLEFSHKLNYNIPPLRISRYIIKGNFIQSQPILINFDNVIKNFFIVEKEYQALIADIQDNGFFKSLDYSNESALFSSEFLNIRFYYGGDNAYDLALEDYKYNGTKTLSEIISGTNGFVSIHYSFSVQIDNSIFFEFGTYLGAFDIEFKNENKGLMITPLSSQIPIMNDSYLNYMRNGYNYDIKIRDVNRDLRQVERNQSISNTSLGMLSINPMKWIKTPISLIQNYSQMGQNFEGQKESLMRMKEDLEMEKNIAQLKGSKLGIEQVNGGVDKVLRINPYYKLGMTIMTSRKSWWKYLEDYFYFYGSKSQYYGIPTHNNRCLFDYLKCRAEFVNKNSLPTQEALLDIIDRLDSGVVFVHKFMNQWTFDSDYKENIEVELYNIINPTNKKKNKRS